MRRRPPSSRQQHLLDAWALWDRYYRPHAQAVFDRAGPSDRDRQLRLHARRVVGWIRTHDATEVSREDVRREALSQRVKAAGADEVIEALEEAGVLREVDDEDDYPGRGRPARRWQVNPALLAKPAAQIAETPGLSSAAGGGGGNLGSRPSAESLARIAEKKTAPDFEGRGRRGRGDASGQRTSRSRSCAGGLAKMITHVLPDRGPPGPLMSSWITQVMSATEWRAPAMSGPGGPRSGRS